MFKILQINKYLFLKGGAETYYFGLIDILKNAGHKIINFSQKNEKNIHNQDKKYFISNIELGRLNLAGLLRIGRIFWSFSASHKIKKLIKYEKPEIAHIHNIYHQISPSILPILKKNHIPTVMTVHDFKLVNPCYTLWVDNKKRRHKKSLITDILLKLEFKFHKWLKVYEKNIDVFIAPSKFVKNKLIKGGFEAEKIKVVPHFINLKSYPNESEKPKNYILYFGRLDESKGIDILIRALKNIKNQNVILKITGSGPQETELKKLASNLNLEKRVEFSGRKNKNELIKMISQSQFTIIPSRVCETFGLAVLESYGCFRPVITTKAGALTEIVKENETGLLIDVDNENQLTQAIDYLIQNSEKANQMGLAGRQLVENQYRPEIHYDKIMTIYKNLLKK